MYQNAAKMHSKCRQNALKKQSNCSQNLANSWSASRLKIFQSCFKYQYSLQIEYWRVISRPDKDHMLLYWCGKIPIQECNGGQLLSRHKSDQFLSQSSLKELTMAAARFNLDLDQMCPSNNEWCPDLIQIYWRITLFSLLLTALQ